MKRAIAVTAALFAIVGSAVAWGAKASAGLPSSAAIDTEVARAMEATGAKGMAVAVIDEGQVVYVQSYGARNAAGQALETGTVMYGASLTKAAFAYMVMQLVQEKRIDLDASIATYLPRPLPDYTAPEVEDKYARWSDLAGDERWRKLTPRILLSHGSGFANFGFLEPDGELRFHFDPGARYAYSGDGMILLQFVLEQGLGLDVGEEMQRRVFDRFAMKTTSMMWRPDFAANLADGWDIDGKPHPHDERSATRAAGSMDTTIADMAKFAAGYVSGAGLSPAGRAELTKSQRAITTATQFPTLQPELPVAARRADLAAGLGVIVFDGPQGHAFEKGGHDDITGNSLHCVEARRRCLLIMSNDVRAEAAFPRLMKFVLGETGAPWRFFYGDMTFW
ncbi:MAG: serine hydrolase domain-containing protein [Micropepsaceae bacterium]